jgi:hypothetical protein
MSRGVSRASPDPLGPPAAIHPKDNRRGRREPIAKSKSPRQRQVARAQREVAQLKTDIEFDDDLAAFSDVVVAHAYERLFDELASRHPQEVEIFSRALRTSIGDTPGRTRRANTASGRAMQKLRRAREVFTRRLARAQGLHRGSRLASVLHSIEHCRFPKSARGHPRRSYNRHAVQDVFDAVRAAVADVLPRMRVAIFEQRGKISKATLLVTPAHWARELAQRLAPQFDAWERDPDYRPARPPRGRKAWREEVAESCLYREIPARLWEDVRDVDAAAGSFVEQRFRIGHATRKRLVSRKSRGF